MLISFYFFKSQSLILSDKIYNEINFFISPDFCIRIFQSQTKNIFEPEKIEKPVQKKHLNQILFLDKVVSIDNLQETDFLKTMTFQEDKDFDIRVFLDNSLVNYLYQLDDSLTVDELLKKEITNSIFMLTEN
jgi:hypothetical protein